MGLLLRVRPWLARALPLVLSVLAALTVFEVGFRLTRKKDDRPRPPPAPRLCAPCSYLFDLNPAHPTVSPDGLRDRAFSPTPPDGTYRILVLGDSLPYGMRVRPEDAFPKVLERALGAQGRNVEVINAGVPGYSPFNELHAYEDKLRAYHPHLVLVTFCMNDVTDPALHWARLITPALADRTPEEAFPSLAYHREHAVPLLDAARRSRESRLHALLARSEIYRRAEARSAAEQPSTRVEAGGKKFLAYLSSEDSLGIEVLTRYDSPEWVWLRAMYDRLAQAVRADGAVFGVVVSPLGYQLEPDYPLLPQALFARYCAERALFCVDLLPTLREHRADKPFIAESGEVLDIWHYTVKGHQLAGDEIAGALRRSGLVPAR